MLVPTVETKPGAFASYGSHCIEQLYNRPTSSTVHRARRAMMARPRRPPRSASPRVGCSTILHSRYFIFARWSKHVELMTPGIFHVTNRVTPGSDNQNTFNLRQPVCSM